MLVYKIASMPAPAQAGPSNSATPLSGAHIHPSPASPILHSPFMQRDDALHPTPDGDLAVGVPAAPPAANGHPHSAAPAGSAADSRFSAMSVEA